LLTSARTEIQVQGQTGRERSFFYIGFQWHMLSWRENLSVHVACVQREASARPGKLKKYTTMHHQKCDVGLFIGQCFEVYRTKLDYWE
jgi:hypothetical protein